MPFWLMTIPIITPFLVLFAGITDADGVQEYIWAIWTVFNKAYLIIILYEVVIKKKRIDQKLASFLFPLFILCVFIFLHNLFFDFDFKSLYHNLTQVIYVIPLLLIFLLNERARPKLKHLYYVCFFILIVQVLWLPLNFEGIFAYVSRYELFVLIPEETDLMPGTFFKSNMLADYVSIVYLFICVDYFNRKKIPSIQFYLVSLMVGLLLVLTGSKMPIVLAILTLIASSILFKRKRDFLFIGVFVLLLSGFSLMASDVASDISENEGLNRITEGLSSFYQSEKGSGGDDNSTISLSTSLIDKYYMRSPFFGNGLSSKGENAYIANGFRTEDFQADARLAFTLVEYGILGLVLFTFFYYSVISFSCLQAGVGRCALYVIFGFLFLFSITEVGIFYVPHYYYVFAYCFGLKRENDILIKL